MAKYRFLSGCFPNIRSRIVELASGKTTRDLRIRDGFVITVLFWLVLGSAGSVPLALSDQLNLSVTDAVFESISGLTTTGATVIIGLDNLPESILFYRQQLQWLGGMGIVVLAVAILANAGDWGNAALPC